MNAAGIDAIRGELHRCERELDIARGNVEIYRREAQRAEMHLLDDVESRIRDLRDALAEAEGAA